jgi:serine O-acetyltransferase
MVEVLLNQLSFFGELSVNEKKLVNTYFSLAKKSVDNCQERIVKERRTLNYFNSHYSIMFLYKLARIIYQNEPLKNCSDSVIEKLYLLNRMLNAIDLYYKIDMPDYFIIGHGLGSVFSRAKYSEYLVVYQNVTIGMQDGKYPEIGERVVIYPNCVVVGNCRIGNNSIIGAGTSLINKSIPDNCVAFEKYGKLIIRENRKSENEKYFIL